jgi:hypothetical protein
MRPLTLLVAAALAALAACAEPPPPEPLPEKGRAETQGIRNTEAIGYAGDHMADRIDESLDAAEEHERRLREAAGEAGDEDPAAE